MNGATSVVRHVNSTDGTRIGFHTSGEGRPLVLLHGASGAHWSFRFLTPLLAERFTVHAVDRRGRGESGDSAGYSIERELEDVAAVVDSLDGPASVFGHSFGGTVALGGALLTRTSTSWCSTRPPRADVVADEDLGRIEELVAEASVRRRSCRRCGSSG